MKDKFLGFSVVSIFFVLSVIAAAQPINYFPQQFYGTVTINGAPAPDGVLVSAKFEGKDVGGTLTSGGRYNLIIAMKQEDEGQSLSFYVQNVNTGIQSTYNGGASVRLDLSASIANFCGDGRCDSGESCSSCPGDCGACPSGGGGTGGSSGGSSGGGGSSTGGGGSGTCTESWICTDWTECSNYVQKRVCADVNRCGTNLTKPIEKQDCVMPIVCNAGERVCAGNKVMVCSALGTTWIEGKTCEKGCSNGICNEDLAASGPAAGAAVLPATGFFLLEPSAWPYWIVVIAVVLALVWLLLRKKKPKAQKK